MTKKILSLIFVLFSVVNTCAMGSSAYSYYDEYDIKNKLIGMHKNNAITRENLELLTNKKLNDSYGDLIAILNAEKDCLYKRLDNETFSRASIRTFSEITQACAGLIGGIPAGGFAGWLVSIPFVAYNDSALKNYNYKVEHGLPTTYLVEYFSPATSTTRTTRYDNISISTTTYNPASTYRVEYSYEPSYTSEQISTFCKVCGLALGAYVALLCGERLYKAYTSRGYYRTQIKLINEIIEIINALHISR